MSTSPRNSQSLSPILRRLDWSAWRIALAGGSALFLLSALESVGSRSNWNLALVSWLAALGAVLIAALPRGANLSPAAAFSRARRWFTDARAETLAVAVLTAAGAALRLYAPADYPSGIHGDEAEFGLIALSIWQGQGPNPFGTAFLGDPALFLYFDAPLLGLLGQNVEALRVFGAICGTLTLPLFYLLVRQMFGMGPALLALTMLAGSAVHIHFSRLALNLPQTLLLACTSLYALRRGQETNRPFWWLATGILGALAMYFHFVGRLLPTVVALYCLYLLVTQPHKWRRWLGGATLMGVGGLMTLAPMAAVLAGRSYQFTEHMDQRLIFTAWPHVTAAYGTTNAVEILRLQVTCNLLAFVSLGDKSDFYTFAGTPMLPALLVPFFVLGISKVMSSPRNDRLALLSIWFWTALVVGMLTTDPPSFHRLLFALPPALIMVALVVHRLIQASSNLGGRGLSRPLAIVLACVVLAAGFTDVSHYFGPAADARPWEVVTAQGRYVAGLGPDYYAYVIGAPHMYFNHGVTRFLAPEVKGETLIHPETDLPVVVPTDHDLAFLVYPHLAGYLPTLQNLYPQGRAEVVKGHTGQTLFVAYLVPHNQAAP